MSARDPFSIEDEVRLLVLLPSLPLRDQALIITGLDTGFRARELGSMEIRHVMGADGQIRTRLTLERRHLKHGRGAYRAQVRSRSVPLSARARAALDRYLAERRTEAPLAPTDALFRSPYSNGRGLSIWQICRIVHRAALRAGCSPDGRFGSHSLRKTFARRVHAACGRDLNLTRIALGHVSVLTTQRYLADEHDRVEGIIMNLGMDPAA